MKSRTGEGERRKQNWAEKKSARTGKESGNRSREGNKKNTCFEEEGRTTESERESGEVAGRRGSRLGRERARGAGLGLTRTSAGNQSPLRRGGPLQRLCERRSTEQVQGAGERARRQEGYPARQLRTRRHRLREPLQRPETPNSPPQDSSGRRMARRSAPEKGYHLHSVLMCCVLLGLSHTVQGSPDHTCLCNTVTNFTSFRAAPDPDACCLNFTGFAIELLEWSLFSRAAGVRVVDLSNCSISHMVDANSIPNSLEALYLNDNLLEKLPMDFLKDAANLSILHLENNRLVELPQSFLQASNHIQEVYLDFNDLVSIPPGVFKPSLVRLGFSNNSLDCTCSLFNIIDKYPSDNTSSDVLGDLTCSRPKNVRGVNIQNVKKGALCRTHQLTALFICLPLLLLLGVTCCCLCSRKKKDSAVSRQQCHLSTVERNGCKNLMENHHYIQCDMSTPAKKEKNEHVKDQMLTKTSTALLGSSRDLYEKVEIKIGTSGDPSVASEGNLYKETPGVKITALKEEEEEREEGDAAGGSETEAETVSVTEVLKNSTDREKLYMNQSTDYYNLVPAIELEDSDHFEYESIDLQ
ncbi:hypothetical protein NDU88_001474 [Pleurodeles waltl]|uniref:LRRCT domain-containing protein n=2 Tax=Pleurodeles waltl TaxID=8319 RepID=A0AAV7T004_PLEWA|nr:hypothetical protein NDU88_001474 [Pleurodeles waltl]